MAQPTKTRSPWDVLLWVLAILFIVSCIVGNLTALPTAFIWFWQAVYGLGALSILFGFGRFLFFRAPDATNPSHTKTFAALKDQSAADSAE